MAAIGNSILDIGASKWGSDEIADNAPITGVPSHFLLPSVPNVSLQFGAKALCTNIIF